MIRSEQVKEAAFKLGARLCGIADADGFDSAPEGYRPTDIFPGARSVVVIAEEFPKGPFLSESPVPYTAANTALLSGVIKMSCDLALWLEKTPGIVAVPVPSEPYEYWDEENKEGRGMMSLKHAGALAGLGSIGKNHILTNRKYGNRIVLGAVLINASLDADNIDGGKPCIDECMLCIDSCPAGAISEKGVNQKLCRSRSIAITKKGYSLYVCNACRRVCPNGMGLREKGDKL